MVDIKEVKAVYLACGFVDFRKSIDGLAIIVQEEFKLDPFSQALFVFCNKSRDRIKILHWDYNGFWLYLKRLEKGQFKWPKSKADMIKIDLNEFKWLLDGYEIRQEKAFKEVLQRAVI